MPVTIKSNKVKFKDGNTYVNADMIADGTTAERLAAINALSTQQQAAIAQKGAQTLASIPADYTSLSDKMKGDFIMHKYILKLTKYSEAGSLTNEVTFANADTPQQLSDLKTKYDKIRYINEDGSVGGKMYKVEPMQGEYVAIADFDSFCSVNAILR